MGFLDKIGWGQEEEKARVLEHPRDLQLGDMLEFSIMPQIQLNSKTMEVVDIWTLNYGNSSHKQVYFNLRDIDQKIRLRVVDNDTLEVALSVLPEQLLQVFSEDDIGQILDTESGVNHHLQAKISNADDLPAELSGWVTQQYRQEGFEIAYRYNNDYRDKAIPDYSDAGEVECDYAWLVSDDRQYSVEFRVFDGGRTEVHLCAMIPLRKIESLWPAAK